MLEGKIDCSSFELPFMASATELAVASGKFDEAAAARLGPSRQLKFLRDAVPKEARDLGEVKSLVSNWTTWRIDDRFYLLRTPGEPYEWALFRITFDDNWEQYDWSGEARASGYADEAAALRAMLPAMFTNWGLDLSSRENLPYRQFLKQYTSD